VISWSAGGSDPFVASDRRALGPAVQVGETLFEVERGRHPLEAHAQLRHRKGHFRLNADDHRFRPPKTRHLRQLAERPDGEGIHHVQRGHIDDDAPGAMHAHLRHHRVPQAFEVIVRERRLNVGDEVVPLLENRRLQGHPLPYSSIGGLTPRPPVLPVA